MLFKTTHANVTQDIILNNKTDTEMMMMTIMPELCFTEKIWKEHDVKVK